MRLLKWIAPIATHERMKTEIHFAYQVLPYTDEKLLAR
jgi:hypothetical protein